MVSYFCVSHPFSVNWKTELPFSTPRISSDILLNGLKMHLELICDGEMYKLDLYVELECEQPKYFTVTTYIFNSSDYPKLTDYSRRLNLRERTSCMCLWEKSTQEILTDLPNIFIDGTMDITCIFDSEFNHWHEKNPVHVSTQTTLNNVDLQSLHQDFSTLLKDKTFSDVQLKCAKRTFYANKCVLGVRSEVFAAMFRNKMAEAETGVVEITDVDPEVLDMLLQYMYSGKSPDLCEETVHSVYEVAEKYAVHGLRQACSNWMAKHQTTDNCLDLLVLAEYHSDEFFKQAVTCFIAEHLSDIDVESWSAFRKNYPLLALSIFEKRCQDWMPGAAKTSGKRT